MPPEAAPGPRVHVRRFGEGGRPALMIHCSLAHSGAWAGVAAHLSGLLAMTAFDLPGHGQSDAWDGRSDYLELSTRIAAGLVPAPVDLIGHSFGGLVALRLALDRPEAVRSLTLVEPVLFAAARGFPEWEVHMAEIAPFLQALEAGRNEAAARAFTALWGTGAAWEELEPRSRAALAERIHLIAAGAGATYEDSGGLLAPDGLEGLAMPAMLIRGSRSPAIIARICEEIGARLPDVGLAEVEGAGHMAPITHPAQMAGLIEVNVSRA